MSGQLVSQARALLQKRKRRRWGRSGVAGALNDEAFVDQLFQDAGERLLGDLQDIEQLGNL